MRMKGIESTSYFELSRIMGAKAIACDQEGKTVIEAIAPGDILVRFAMSVIVNGIGQRFIMLAVPVVIIPAKNDLEIVKDSFAIAFVVMLDNLEAWESGSFKVLMSMPDEVFSMGAGFEHVSGGIVPCPSCLVCGPA